MAEQTPDDVAAMNRLNTAVERFGQAVGQLPAGLAKQLRGWPDRRLDRLDEQLAEVLVLAEDLAGLVGAERDRRARQARPTPPRRPSPRPGRVGRRGRPGGGPPAVGEAEGT